MSDPEVFNIVGGSQKPAISARRRLQNRVAQQKYRERQRSNASATAEQSGTEFADRSIVDVEAGSQRLPQEISMVPFANYPAETSLGFDQSLWQWNTSSAAMATSPVNIVHDFDMTLEDALAFNGTLADTVHTDLSTSSDPDFLYLRDKWHSAGNTEPMTWLGGPGLTTYERNDRPSNGTPSEQSSSLVSSPLIQSRSSTGHSSSSSSSSMDQLLSPQELQLCVDSSSAQSPLLHAAIQTRKKSMVRLLLRRGVSDVNERDLDGRTALHMAAQLGDEEMVETLLSYGADLSALDGLGQDVLRCAVLQGHDRVVEILLDAIARKE